MRYLSVCSGIEAASVAWKPFGWTAAGYSEIEPFPRAVLQARFGAEPVDWDHRYAPQSNMLPLFGDFTKIEEHHVGPIDLLVGGTPCQSFSVAGKRLGLDDPRGHLTLEYLALAKRLRPRWVVWENVPGVLSDDEGRTLGTFLRLLGELGYRWAYRVLDAQYVRVDGFEYAVPQRRRRVFVVGHLGDDARAAVVLFDRESLRGNPAPRRQAGKGVAHTIAARTRGGGGLGTDFDCDGGLICSDVAPTLNAAFGDKLELEDQHINGGGDCLLPPVSMCLNAGAMGRRDAETETLIPTTGAVFDVAHAIQAGALRENPNSGPDGVGVQEGIAYTLEARSEVQAVAHALRGEGFDASEDGTGRGTPIVPVSVAPAWQAGGNQTGGSRPYGTTVDTCDSLVPVAFAQNQRDEVRMMDVAGALAAEPGMKQQTYVAMPEPFTIMERGREGGSNLEFRQDGTSNAILTPNGGRGGRGGLGVGAIAAEWAVRRLTPTECERLQGFPDNWTKIAWRKKPEADCPDGPRYKAVGNSMAVNVMRFIGERIAEVDQIA